MKAEFQSLVMQVKNQKIKTTGVINCSLFLAYTKAKEYENEASKQRSKKKSLKDTDSITMNPDNELDDLESKQPSEGYQGVVLERISMNRQESDSNSPANLRSHSLNNAQISFKNVCPKCLKEV